MSNDDKKWCVYVHTNKVNGKKYVGITCQKPEERWNSGHGYKTQLYFWNAIQKYGWHNFEHEILLTNETKKFACAAEKCLIKAYASNNRKYGYNLSSGGECGSAGIPWTEERRKALSAKLKGRKFSDEWREKISKAKTGTHVSDETKKKLSEQRQGELNNFYGKYHSEEAKNKMREAKIGKPTTEKQIEALKLGRGTTYWTDETYKKLSQCNRGEKSTSAKLKEEDVIDILRMIQSKIPYSEIKKKYSVQDSEISRIKYRKRWGYLYDKFPELYT